MAETPLEQIRAISKPASHCVAGAVLKHPDYGKDIQEALDDPQCSLVGISTWLGEHNIEVKSYSFSKHRNGQCSCQR